MHAPKKWGLLRLQHRYIGEKGGKTNKTPLSKLSAIAFVLTSTRVFSAPSLMFYSPKKEGGKLSGLFSFSQDKEANNECYCNDNGCKDYCHFCGDYGCF